MDARVAAPDAGIRAKVVAGQAVPDAREPVRVNVVDAVTTAEPPVCQAVGIIAPPRATRIAQVPAWE